MISLESLRCFCALVETGNFQSAAEAVHKTQPAISQQLKSLERQLGHAIYDRKTSSPTREGGVLYERGRRLLNGAQELERAVLDVSDTPGGELRVGASDTNALYYLPGPVRRFTAKLPEVHLSIKTRSTDEVAGDVARGDLDIAIVTLPVSEEGLDSTELFRQQFVLVVPKKDVLARRTRIDLRQLRDRSFVLLDEGTRTGAHLQKHFRSQQFEPRVVLNTGSFEVIKRYVSEGVGLSFLPKSAVTTHELRSLSTVRVPNLPEIPIGAVWRRDAYLGRAASEFLEMLDTTGSS